MSDIYANQHSLLRSFVQHLAYYRVLRLKLEESNIQSQFWVKTCDAHLIAATLEWCKVFGSDCSNETHWKSFLSKTFEQEEATQIKDAVRSKILEKTKLTSSEWKGFWQEMTDFRNRYVSHLEVGNIPKVPSYDQALQAVFAYDEVMRNTILYDNETLCVLYNSYLGELESFEL